MKAFKPINNIRDIRKKLGLNQIEFWGQVGVTQSGGSRYEAGRTMPKPVRELVRLVHIEQLDIAKLNRADVLISEKLKEKHPEIYSALKAEVAKA
ncbi:putative transcriptional regulator [Neisseria sp. HSC-16F19]|nr:transcriptional regulator [Neisseria sp. HSC-16F19]MCP2041420.1 putative transcriptional regulator [Neisseria sp. HSC-16F19]